MSYNVERGSHAHAHGIVFTDATGKYTVYRIADYGLALDVCRLLNQARVSGYEAGHRAGFTQGLNVEHDAAMQRHPSRG